MTLYSEMVTQISVTHTDQTNKLSIESAPLYRMVSVVAWQWKDRRSNPDSAICLE